VFLFIKIREVEKEAHIQSLANRSEPLHQEVIEAREMIVLQRCDDRVGKCHGTCDDRGIMGAASFNQGLVENTKIALKETLSLFEKGDDMRGGRKEGKGKQIALGEHAFV
jgi:hypothetical protein